MAKRFQYTPLGNRECFKKYNKDDISIEIHFTIKSPIVEECSRSLLLSLSPLWNEDR